MERCITKEIISYIPEEFWEKHKDINNITLRIAPKMLKNSENFVEKSEEVFWFLKGNITCTYYETLNTIEFSLINNNEDELALRLIGGYDVNKKKPEENEIEEKELNLLSKVSEIEIDSISLKELNMGTYSWFNDIAYAINHKKLIIKNCDLFEYTGGMFYNNSRIDTYTIYFEQHSDVEVEVKDIEIIDCAISAECIKGSMTSIFKTERLKIKGLLAPKLTNMAGIFKNSPNLKTVQLIDCKFNVLSNVEEMFRNDKALEKLDITNSFSKSPIINYGYIFYKCEKLEEIIGLETMNLMYVNYMQFAFKDCTHLKKVNLIKLGERTAFSKSGISAERLESMIMEKQQLLDIRGLFSGCNKLKEINLENIHNIKCIYDVRDTFKNISDKCKIKLTQPIKALRYNSKNEKQFGLYYEYAYEPIEGVDKLSLKEFSLFEQYFELNKLSLEGITYAITDTSNISSIDLETLNVIPVELDDIDDIQKELAKSIIFNEIIYQRSNCVLTYSEESNTLKIIAKEIKKN